MPAHAATTDRAGADARRCEARPFFLDGARGRLFAVHHVPVGRPLAGTVLFVAPFNEEMNRCRSMITLQALALARQGVGTLIVDLYGTGDSEGAYVDARWETWLADLHAAAQWLTGQEGGCRALWGLRLGALLAAQAHGALGRGCDLVLWQPVLDGKLHFTQFLRVKIAGQMDRTDVVKETTASLRARLADGEPVEIAGYEIHPGLAAALDAARLADVQPAPGTRVLWLERAAAGATASPAGQNVIQTWRDGGAAVDALTFEGAEFWQLHERSVAPAAIEATTPWVTGSATTTPWLSGSAGRA